MEVSKFEIDGLLLITPKVFHDDRGYFFESYNESLMQANGITLRFVQDNQSCSRKGVLRGLHFQAPPFDQGKLVRVVRGSVLDVAVDIRKDSPTYGQHIGVTLSAVNQKMLWIPPGFAHGFLSLEEDTIFLYKCTNVYDRASEGGLRWNDPDLGIQWGEKEPLVSTKDLELPRLNQFISPFSYTH
jgi:dTDP-4-dehydrorhamnose 3,5-epimerase